MTTPNEQAGTSLEVMGELETIEQRPRVRVNGKFIRTLEQMELDHRAAMYRSKGKSYREVATEMKVSVSSAYEMVRRAIADIPREATDELVTMELAKLDYLETEAVAIMAKKHPIVTVGGKVAMFDGEILIDDSPVLQAINALLKVADRRAKLLGLNAPTRTELTGKDGGAIEVADRSSEAKASVLALLDRLKEAG